VGISLPAPIAIERTTGTPQPQLEPLALYLLRALNSGLHLFDPVSRLQFLFYIGHDALGPSCVLVPGHEAYNQPPMAATGVSRYKSLPAAALLGRHAI